MLIIQLNRMYNKANKKLILIKYNASLSKKLSSGTFSGISVYFLTCITGKFIFQDIMKMNIIETYLTSGKYHILWSTTNGKWSR